MVGPADGLRCDRRALLALSAVAAGGLALADVVPGTTRAFAAGDRAGAAARRLAKLLTGRLDLAPEFVKRARLAFLAIDPAFDARLVDLDAGLRRAGLANADAFRASPLAREPALMATAVALVRALYTGRVGKGRQGRLVSYEEALMYRPTADVTVIPTYARGEPGSWADMPPAESPLG